MLLIPEQVYQGLVAGPSDGTARTMVQSRLQKVGADRRLNPNAREIRYQQEFKRYNKLAREEEERPVDVKLRNLDEIASAVMQQQQQQQASSSGTTTNVPPAPSAQKQITKKLGHHPRRRRHHGRAHSKVPTRKKAARRVAVKKEIMGSNGSSDDEIFGSVSEDPRTPLASTSQQPEVPPAQRRQHVSSSSSVSKNRAISHYFQENAASLGVNVERGMLQQKVGVPGQLLKTSNIDDLITHILRNRGTRKRPLPTGYEEFLRRTEQHPVLRELLGLDQQQQQQSGQGGMSTFKRYKKPVVNDGGSRTLIKFKPTLWG